MIENKKDTKQKNYCSSEESLDMDIYMKKNKAVWGLVQKVAKREEERSVGQKVNNVRESDDVFLLPVQLFYVLIIQIPF